MPQMQWEELSCIEDFFKKNKITKLEQIIYLMQIKDFIKKYDTQNQFKVLQDSISKFQMHGRIKLFIKTKKEKISSIVFCGLGGSAISGDCSVIIYQEELNLLSMF